jgi:hypothetical protein
MENQLALYDPIYEDGWKGNQKHDVPSQIIKISEMVKKAKEDLALFDRPVSNG